MESKNLNYSPIAVNLEADKNTAWCACGKSSNQPFCDGSHSGTGISPKLFKVAEAGTYYLCTCKKSANAPYCDGAHKTL
jgi:CDGSH-type Zn-finger protein